MKLLYIDSTTTLTLDQAKSFIHNIYNFNIIGNGTYCSTTRISEKLVIKHYRYSDNFDSVINDYSEEITSEIFFIKNYNYLSYVAKTDFIILYQKDIYIFQEYLKLYSPKHTSLQDLSTSSSYFLKLLAINMDLLVNHNYLNIDIKHTNVGYDSNDNLKIFDFNLFIKVTDFSQKINLYSKYSFYYLHPIQPFKPEDIILYSIAILILESLSSYSECNKYIYKLPKLKLSKFVLLQMKKNVLSEELFKILHMCFNAKYTAEQLYENLGIFANISHNH
jgi:hypothetical protein